jgi:hypothetical protein
MEAVSDLKGIWGTSPASQSISIGTVSDQNAHARMTLKPISEGPCLASLKDIDRLMAFQVYQQGGVGAATFQGELIHS